MISDIDIQPLALADWGTHVPNPDKKAKFSNDFKDLKRITELVKNAILLQKPFELIQEVVHKCCQFARHLKTGGEIIRAFRIIDDLLRDKRWCYEEDFQLAFSFPFILNGDQEYPLPAYYKIALACDSYFFKARFASKLPAVSQNQMKLEFISRDCFAAFIQFLEGDSEKFEVPKDRAARLKMAEELIELGLECQQLGLRNFLPHFIEMLEAFFYQLNYTKENFELGLRIYKALDIGIGIEKAPFIAHYFGHFIAQNWLEKERQEFVRMLNDAHIQYLDIPGDWFFPMTKLGLTEIHTLKTLKIDGYKLDGYNQEGKSIQLLKTLRLQSIEVHFNDHIHRGDLAKLAGLPITALDLGGQKHVEPDELEILRDLPLTSLNLLSLSCVTDQTLELLRGKRLNFLSLYNCKSITDKGLEYLAINPIENLILERCEKITNKGLLHLLGMPLVSLNIELCNQLDDESLRLLATLPLRALNIKHLKKITDAGLIHLIQCPLKCIQIRGCTNVTAEGKQMLRDAIADLRLIDQ